MLTFAQRTHARELFRAIQQRTPYHVQQANCPSCGLSFEDSPDCRMHPGLCCMCVDEVARIERKVISHVGVER